MSFDLKIFNGDLIIGPNGDVDIVQNSEKLIQDILKILMTEVGSNPFFPWYGSLISKSMVGSAYESDFLFNMAQSQIRSSLETLQNLQKEQLSRQKVTASEMLAAVKEISVRRNEMDPTYFSVYIAVLTKSLKTEVTQFTISQL